MGADAANLDAHFQKQEPLEPREMAVLSELARETEAKVAFQGLRRRLDLHPEALSRTLRRLENQGLVSKEDAGYKLTEAGFGKLAGRPATPPAREVVTLMQALLPPHLGPEALAEEMSRRWFRGLRWYGQSAAPGEQVLVWLTEPDNATVKLRITGDVFTLEVEARPGEARRSFAQARSLLSAIAEAYGLLPEADSAVDLASGRRAFFAA